MTMAIHRMHAAALGLGLMLGPTLAAAADRPAPAEIAPAGGAKEPDAGGSPAAQPAQKITKQVPGRFTVQFPAGAFAFAEDAAERNRLTATHLKAAVNGVVVSILTSKAAAGELDGAVQKAVDLVSSRPGLREVGHEEIAYGGHKAYKYIFAGDAKDRPTLYFSYLLRDDERVYVLTASVFTAHRKAFEEIFDQIAQSIAKDVGGGGANAAKTPAPTAAAPAAAPAATPAAPAVPENTPAATPPNAATPVANPPVNGN